MEASSMRLAAVLYLLCACRPPGYGRHDIDAPPVEDGPHPVDAARDAATSCDQTFRLTGHGGATTAWVTGSFTSWGGDPAHGAIAMTLGGDMAWTTSHVFSAGSYQYKFIL